MKKALILTDAKAGHENQSRALASYLGYDFDIVEIHFKNSFFKALSYLLDWLGVHASGLFCGLSDSFNKTYDLVIGTGSGVFYATKVLASKLKVPSAVVLYPRGYKLSTFDCILAPSFDNPRLARNIIPLEVNLVSNNKDSYCRAVESFKAKYRMKGRDVIAVIIGGPNKCSSLTKEWMKKELDKIFKANEGCEFWVTTSRRTPKDVEEVVQSYNWDYSLIYSLDKYNPIPAFVMLAKKLYVTAESTGMISESCIVGTSELEVLDNLKSGNHKFRRFIDKLKNGGYIGGSKKINLDETMAKVKQLISL
jgi:mitochondrial fission protein ELM1